MICKNTESYRPITLSDTQRLYAIEKGSILTPWTDRDIALELSAESGFHRALCGETTVVAFCLARLTSAELHIMHIATDEAFKRRGFGRHLLSELFKEAKMAGATKIFLEVATNNRPALNLYASLEFVRDGVRKKYYASGEDAILMSLKV